MPESIFKQIALDILRLHQHTNRSLLAVQHSNSTKIHDTVYATLNGRYYVMLPAQQHADSRQSIFLIETENSDARLSWIADTHHIQQKGTLYRRALAALCNRMAQTKLPTDCNRNACLVELVPQQGLFTLGNNQDFVLSPIDLVKALYPAASRKEAFTR